MTDLIQLTDVEIAAVSGGNSQSISIYATQTNISSVSQTATATNTGRVTATAYGWYATAAAVGAASSNFAAVSQANVIWATNSIRY